MRFSIRQLLVLTTFVAVGMYAYPALILNFSNIPPKVEFLGEEGYQQTIREMRIGGGIMGAIFYLQMVWLMDRTRRKQRERKGFSKIRSNEQHRKPTTWVDRSKPNANKPADVARIILRAMCS